MFIFVVAATLLLAVQASSPTPPATLAPPPTAAVLVVGSVNADVIVPLDRMPMIGETIVAKDTAETHAGITVAGGKGANQAVACSRLGVNTRFVCKFGGDANADMLQQTLIADGVDTSQCEKMVDKPSGLGLVLLQEGGTVSCIVCSGANGAWHEEKVQQQCKQLFADDVLSKQDIACVLLQMEVPQFVNEQIAAAATAAGIPVFQDIGGEEREISSAHYSNCLYIAPNKSELKRLSRLPVDSDGDIIAAAKSLQAKGARNVLVTLGEEGCLLVTEQGDIVRQAGLKVAKVVDETGAGDNFRAAYCVRLFAEKKSIVEALLFASSAAAVSVTKLGAIPSCTTRAECLSFMQASTTGKKIADAPRGGATAPSVQKEEEASQYPSFPLQFASRLNSMSDRPDLWQGEQNVVGWIKRQGEIKGLDLVDFNYPQHLTSKVSEEEKQNIVGALDEANLKCGAICLRYHKSQFQLGAMTHPDPVVRERAIELVNEACEWAKALGAKEVVVWSAFCGYDYPLQVDYDKVFDDVVSAFQVVCDKHPQIKVSLEYKPTDENTRYFAVPSTGAAILLAKDVNRANFGLTLDFGHCLMAGENPAQCVAMVAKQLGGDKLFGVQLGDSYSRLGAEDGLAFGSIHPMQGLEFVLYLIKTNFKGHVYFDTFPRNEDPIRECEYNIRRFMKMHRFASKMLSKDGGIDLQHVLKQHDSMSMLEYLEEQSAF